MSGRRDAWHRGSLSTAVERLRSRPGRHDGRTLRELVRACRYARFTPNTRHRRARPGCTGTRRAAARGNGQNVSVLLQGRRQTTSVIAAFGGAPGLIGTAWAAQARHHRPPSPRAARKGGMRGPNAAQPDSTCERLLLRQCCADESAAPITALRVSWEMSEAQSGSVATPMPRSHGTGLPTRAAAPAPLACQSANSSPGCVLCVCLPYCPLQP